MELLEIGKILSTHHLKGSVKFLSKVDDLDLLFKDIKVIVEKENSERIILTPIEVKHFLNDKWVIKFSEINDVNDATKLRNSIIKVRSDLVDLVDIDIRTDVKDEFIGFSAIDIENGEPIGVVVETLETSGHNVFVIDSDDFETMVPHVDEFVKGINFEEKLISIKLIDGLKNKKSKKK